MSKFEWDDNKNKSNQLKHNISFEDAKEVFQDSNRVQYISNNRQYGERRWKTVGSILGIITTVVYTVRATIFRIISARRANKKEYKDYFDASNKKP